MAYALFDRVKCLDNSCNDLFKPSYHAALKYFLSANSNIKHVSCQFARLIVARQSVTFSRRDLVIRILATLVITPLFRELEFSYPSSLNAVSSPGRIFLAYG
jgi:hypothetical protein